jgi:hypothetical protein
MHYFGAIPLRVSNLETGLKHFLREGIESNGFLQFFFLIYEKQRALMNQIFIISQSVQIFVSEKSTQ